MQQETGRMGTTHRLLPVQKEGEGKMKRLISIVGLLSLLIFTSESWAVDLKYAGSVTILDGVMKDAAPLFEKKTGKKIGLSGGGSGAGVKSILAGLVDIAGVSRDLKEEEIKKGLVPYTIGWGGVGLIAHKDITVDNLTKKQVKEIMTGKTKNWKEVGGPDLPIKIAVTPPGCACRDEFQESVMDKEPYIDGATISPIPTLSETIKNTTGGVGPLTTVAIDRTKVKVITIDGVAPTHENIKSKKYIVSREINIVTKGPATGVAKEFIDYMLSKEGQDLMEKKGFVRIK